jgi:hypothetical protein
MLRDSFGFTTLEASMMVVFGLVFLGLWYDIDFVYAQQVLRSTKRHGWRIYDDTDVGLTVTRIAI